MPKPQDVIRIFKKRMSLALDHHKELMVKVSSNRRQASLEAMLVEDFVLSASVMWEAFVNDLILSYVCETPDTYLDHLENKINQSVTNKFGASIAKQVKFIRPAKLKRVQAIRMIDPNGWNITADCAQGLSDRANELLTASHAKKFSLEQEDREFLDFLVPLRNFLSHRSKGSRDRLNSAISRLTAGGRNSNLKGKFTTAGAFLKVQVPTGNTRATEIARRLVEIVQKLG